MTTTDTAREQDAFVGLAFPVIRVRYVGPTNHRGSRFIATLRGVRHVEPYDYAISASRVPYNAAAAVLAKYREQTRQVIDWEPEPVVLVPGDLADDTYSYTVVPASFFGGAS